jgi:hypothetical protein
MDKDFCKKCDCGEKQFIVNRTHWLCEKKNRERLDGQQSQTVKKSKLSSFFKTSAKQKENIIRLKEVYAEISNEREHICESCGTKEMLSHSHIIPRSRRKDLECDKENIIYQCLKCHHIWEHGTAKEKAGLPNFEKIIEYIKKVDSEFYSLITQKWQR